MTTSKENGFGEAPKHIKELTKEQQESLEEAKKLEEEFDEDIKGHGDVEKMTEMKKRGGGWGNKLFWDSCYRNESGDDLFRMIRAYIKAGVDKQEAYNKGIEIYNKYIDLSIKLPDISQIEPEKDGMILAKLYQGKGTKESLNEAVKIYLKNEYIHTAADIFMELKDYKKAAEIYKKILEIGEKKEAVEKHKDALRFLDKASSKFSGVDDEANVNRGDVTLE